MDFYNEIDLYAAQWLRNLIAAGELPPGVVDTRDVRRIEPDELRRYRRCHFFAGIGGWALALELAGWPADVAVWTGSCPCQPFSAAGKSAGFADERHLWPFWFHLIDQCRPPVVLGEQVAAAVKHGWLDLVHADLEGCGYAVGDADLCAAGVGAPHIRQRLFFVADRGGIGRRRGAHPGGPVAQDARQRGEGVRHAEPCGLVGLVADSSSTRLEGRDARALGHECEAAERGGGAGALADCVGERRGQGGLHAACGAAESGRREDAGVGSDGAAGFWSDADWIACRDGKSRPVEPGTFPLAHGAPSRVGRLRAYGNAIVPQVAAEFVAAFLDVKGQEIAR